MPSWKKVIVSGSDARIATLFTSGHLTASSDVLVEGNIRGLTTSTASFAYFTASADSTSSFAAIDADMYYGDGSGLTGVLRTNDVSSQNVNGTKTFISELQLLQGTHIYNNKGVRFEGSSDDGYYTELLSENATQTRQILLPNAGGTIALTSDLHSAVTLDDSSYNYLTLAGQEITLGRINIEEDTNLAAGAGLSLTGATISLNPAAITGSWSSQYFNTISAAGITGSFTPTSSSFSTRITANSSSFSERITSDSSSFSTRVSANEALLDQSVKTTDDVQFANLTVDGDILAQRFIVSSSVSHITSSFSSGSTVFGDTLDDTHVFSGSLDITGSFEIEGSIKSNGLGVVSSSGQIATEISGAFFAPSQSIATSRNAHSQSVAARIANVEAGNVGDGSSSGNNTGDVTLNTSSHDFLSIDGNQQITLGPIDASTDLTGTLLSAQLNGSTAATAISGAFGGTSSSLATRIDDLVTDSSSFSTRVAAVETSAGGQDLSITGTPTFTSLTLSGSLKISGSKQSTSIEAQNIQNGYPTSNNWQESLEGSYFNNFDNTTHVSEILRFMAGVISHSIDTASPTPNTKILNTINTTFTGVDTTSKNTLFNGVLGSSHETAKLSMHFTSSAAINMTQYNQNDVTLKYLIHRGFVTSGERGSFGNDTGTNPFSDNYGTNIPTTISDNDDFDNFTFTVASSAGGSTSIRSSADNELFGLGGLSSGNANPYTVRVIASQSFSDTNTEQTPTAVSNTFHTNSIVEFSNNSFGSSNGLTIAKINTASPAVIPAAFQDGKFTSVSAPITGRFAHGGSQNENELSSSGYYRFHDIKAAIQTGSGNFNFKTIGGNGDNKKLFYLYTGGINTDITNNVPNPVVSNANLVRTAFTATSRSLSGAPYLLTTTYSQAFSSEVTKSFDPAYKPLNALAHDMSNDGLNTVGTSNMGSHTTVNIDSNGVNTSQANVKGVLSNDKSTLRSDGDIPHITDIAFLSSSYTFTLDSSFNNVVQTRTGQTSLNYTTTFRSTGRNWKNSSTVDTSTSFNFYDATLFNQPSASGSMAIYSFAQNYDSNNLQDTTETFTGENHRIQLTNDVLEFDGDAWNTTYNKNNLGRNDLQVKPGYLVNPTGDYGYWYPTTYTGAGTNISGYRYYIRRFQTNGSTFNSMTIDVGATLYKWKLDTNSPSDNVSVGLIFKSFASNGGTSSTYTRIFDPSDFTGNDVGDSVGGIYNNPFSDSINKRGNPNGSVSGTTYTVPLSNADGQTLDASNNEIYVIIRYRNDPTPITGITLTFS